MVTAGPGTCGWNHRGNIKGSRAGTRVTPRGTLRFQGWVEEKKTKRQWRKGQRNGGTENHPPKETSSECFKEWVKVNTSKWSCRMQKDSIRVSTGPISEGHRWHRQESWRAGPKWNKQEGLQSKETKTTGSSSTGKEGDTQRCCLRWERPEDEEMLINRKSHKKREWRHQCRGRPKGKVPMTAGGRGSGQWVGLALGKKKIHCF